MKRLRLIFWPATQTGKILLALFLGPLLFTHFTGHGKELINGQFLFFFGHLVGKFIFGMTIVSVTRAPLVLFKVLKPSTNSEEKEQGKGASDKFDKIAAENLPPGEFLVTRFLGVYRPNLAWALLFGPFMYLAMKQYLVVVTNKSYVFLKFGMLGGAPQMVGRFNRDEVALPVSSKRILTVYLTFSLPNGRKLRLLVSKLKTVGLNEKVEELFLKKVA
jgi:hypothetical protein